MDTDKKGTEYCLFPWMKILKVIWVELFEQSSHHARPSHAPEEEPQWCWKSLLKWNAGKKCAPFGVPHSSGKISIPGKMFQNPELEVHFRLNSFDDGKRFTIMVMKRIEMRRFLRGWFGKHSTLSMFNLARQKTHESTQMNLCTALSWICSGCVCGSVARQRANESMGHTSLLCLSSPEIAGFPQTWPVLLFDNISTLAWYGMSFDRSIHWLKITFMKEKQR